MKIAFVFASVLLATPADARFMTLGQGTRSCGTWTEERTGNRSSLREAWVFGFVSGHNAYSSANRNLGETLDDSALLGWIDNYCKDHPLDTIATAAQELVSAITAKR